MSLDPLPVPSSASPSVGKAYVVILNWNGWRDTVECLETVCRSDYPDYQVIVCDNDSRDGSMGHLVRWAAGSQLADHFPPGPLRALSQPPIPKPLSYIEYDRTTAERGGDDRVATARLILLRTGANLGFAGGINVALRFVLARDDFSYVWLLNNDTVVRPDALSALVRRTRESPRIGLCGSTLLYYGAPDTVQVRGGVAYNRWFATMRPLAQGKPRSAAFNREHIERLMKYPAGASMLVTRDFLRAVGLLSESYFLYYEELDWVTRSEGRFAMAYSPDSVVYHKEGASINAAADDGFHLADYYSHRNRLRYTRRFLPVALPTVMLRTLGAVLARVWRGQPRRAWTLMRLTFEADTYAWPARDSGPREIPKRAPDSRLGHGTGRPD